VKSLKISCDSRFQRAFTACVCVFKVITLVGLSQRNYFENATACSKGMLKTTVATQLYGRHIKVTDRNAQHLFIYSTGLNC